MKLSTAIMLGSTTCKMIPGNWNCCAIGAAANAIGIPQVAEDFTALRYDPIAQEWPWISGGLGRDQMGPAWWDIAEMFDREVCEGRMTLEQLVDYVRSIEPQCGDCCKFDCTCSKTEAVPESVVVEVA